MIPKKLSLSRIVAAVLHVYLKLLSKMDTYYRWCTCKKEFQALTEIGLVSSHINTEKLTGGGGGGGGGGGS